MSEDTVFPRTSIVEIPGGATIVCTQCRTILVSGWRAIGVEIGRERFLVGPSKPLKCCGEERETPLLFDTEGAAGLPLLLVEAEIADKGNAHELPLVRSPYFKF